MDDQRSPTSLVIPEEIYGQIINNLSLYQAIKVAKTNSILAEAALLYYPWDLGRREVCLSFKGLDLNTLLKNTNINRTNLFGCSIFLKDEAFALNILTIAKNNPENKQHQVDLNDNFVVDTSSNGLTELTKVLLNEYGLNPSHNSNLAIKLAFKNRHDVIVDLLLESPRFNYDDTDLITLALDYQAEDILIRIVGRIELRGGPTIRSIWMYKTFKVAVNIGMFKLITYMIRYNKVYTQHIKSVVGNLARIAGSVETVRKVMKILVNKYRDDRNPGVYPEFILDIIYESIYSLKMFKMMIKETKINPGINNNIILRLSSNTVFSMYGGRRDISVFKYLLTKYEDQVDPSVMNFKVFWTVYLNRRNRGGLNQLLDIIIDHPKIKYNPKLDAEVLSEIYKYKK